MIMVRPSVLDLRLFPLVLLELPERIDGSYVAALEEAHRALYARSARYVSFTDARRVNALPDAVSRKRLAEWTKDQESSLKRWQVANVLVVSSGLVRAGLAAIHWVAPPAVPTAVETDPVAGASFLTRKAADAGLVLPPGAQSWFQTLRRTG